MFESLGSSGHNETSATRSIAISLARLQVLRVGITACDAFISTVASVLSCTQMPIEMRAQLGAETAEFWSLPNDRLPESARHKMAEVCRKSLVKLEDQTRDVGCMP